MILYQPLGGYCYNSDTHFLYDFIVQNLKKFKNIQGELLDIGSGSGILGILLAKNYQKLSLNQCEKQKVFQFLSQKNASINHIETTLFTNEFNHLDENKKFDIIVSNPPFYHQNVIKTENPNIKTARYNDSLTLDTLIKKTSQLLNNGGKFFFCYDVKQFNDIMKLSNMYGLNIESVRFVHPKQHKDATLVMVYLRKNSKSLMNVLPPLIMFNNDQFTQEVLDIYSTTATHSIKCDILKDYIDE